MRIEIVRAEDSGCRDMICLSVVGDWGLYRLVVVRCISGRMLFQLESGGWRVGTVGGGADGMLERSWQSCIVFQNQIPSGQYMK
jgi:hypothetical protein